MNINQDNNPMIINQGQDLVNTRNRLYLNNLFYTIVEPNLFLLYSLYLRPSLETYDGIIPGFHDFSVGRVPQGLISAITQGTKQLLFKKPVSFNVESDEAYNFFKDWSKNTNLDETLKLCWVNACAGGTALLRLNEDSKGLPWLDAVRIDHFYVNTDNKKSITRCVVYIDSFDSVSNRNEKVNYSLVEERYFDDENVGWIEYNYYVSPSLVNINNPPKVDSINKTNFKQLPNHIRTRHLKNYGSIRVGEPLRLPYSNSLGVALMKFSEAIPGYEELPLGQPLSEILLNDSCQYDISKQFGTLEGYVALPRIMVPTPYRKSGNGQLEHSLDGFVYVNYAVSTTDNVKPEALQFNFRTNENRVWRDSILEDCSLKINIDSNTIASWLSSTNSNTTATAIISSKSKTDMFICDKAPKVCEPVNSLLKLIAHKKGYEVPTIELHCQSIIDPATALQVYGKELDLGHITPEFYVKQCFAEMDRKSQQELINNIKMRKMQSGIAG